jgi:hypothetical protein
VQVWCGFVCVESVWWQQHGGVLLLQQVLFLARACEF